MRRLLLPLVAACAVPADFDPGLDSQGTAPPAGSMEQDAGAAQVYVEAAEAFDVPVALLLAIAEDTRHTMVEGEVEFDGQIPTVGMLALRDDLVEDAAALLDVDPVDVRRGRRANVRAAAATLSRMADRQGIDRGDLGAWAPVVATYSGIPTLEGQAHYVHDEIYARIQRGLVVEGYEIKPQKVLPDFPEPPESASLVGAERAYAIWRASPNHSARPSGSAGDPSMVIVHTCEGSYSGCWSWLANGSSGVSAHYVVNSDGSEITQLVQESRKAWHISATYDCDLNGGRECGLDGASSNNFTIGIEHAGYGSQTSWSSGLLAASARLVCDITRAHQIPRDRYHIVGHGQLQPWNRSDPGPNWPWSSYLADVAARCGDGGTSGGGSGGTSGGSTGGTSGGSTGGGTSGGSSSGGATGVVIVDSNNANNKTSLGYVSLSGNWTSSQTVRGYWASGYWWRSTGATADPATFLLNVSQDACWQVEAWWPAGTDRAPAAPWLVRDAGGRLLGTVTTDQRQGGGRWNVLGSWRFTKGWNRVELSRWTTAGAVVVADAVRFSPSSACGGSAGSGSGSAGLQIVIDSDDANNGAGADVEFSSAWTSSRGAPDYYGSDYRWHDTGSGSDPMHFWFYLDAPRRMAIEARWTTGANRSRKAPWVVVDALGTTLATVRVDQQANHATWVKLGAWDFPRGWNRIDLSHWTDPGAVVIGDAVRATEVR